jgi:hypothetical protein
MLRHLTFMTVQTSDCVMSPLLRLSITLEKIIKISAFDKSATQIAANRLFKVVQPEPKAIG